MKSPWIAIGSSTKGYLREELEKEGYKKVSSSESTVGSYTSYGAVYVR